MVYYEELINQPKALWLRFASRLGHWHERLGHANPFNKKRTPLSLTFLPQPTPFTFTFLLSSTHLIRYRYRSCICPQIYLSILSLPSLFMAVVGEGWDGDIPLLTFLWWMASENERPKGQQGEVISAMKCYAFSLGNKGALHVWWYCAVSPIICCKSPLHCLRFWLLEMNNSKQQTIHVVLFVVN